MAFFSGQSASFNPNSNPYGIQAGQQNEYERQANVTSPAFGSMVDGDGNLKTPYKIDPSQSEAFSRMKGVAESGDLSPWAQLQMQQNDLSTAHQRDQSNAQSLGSQQQGMEQMMATGGGANSGSAAFLANQGARNSVMANQNIGAQSQQNALSIQSTDAQNKQNLLGQVANTETGAQSANAGLAQQDLNAANLYNVNRYHEQMQAWGAANTADSQEAAAQQSGGGKK